MATPVIIPPDTSNSRPIPESLFNLVQNSLNLFAAAGAFKGLTAVDNAKISVKFIDQLFELQVESFPDRFERKGYKASVPMLRIGDDLFNNQNSICAQQLAAGFPPMQIMAHALGHEIFHLGQDYRMMSCGISNYESKPLFSKAMRPTFSTQTIEAMRIVARHIREFEETEPKTSPAYLKTKEAQDCMTELCADLVGLMWMRKIGLWSQSFEDDLISRRIAVANLGPKNYQIGAHLASSVGKKSEQAIVDLTCKLGLALLANSPIIPATLSTAASTALNVFRQVEPKAPSMQQKVANAALSIKNSLKLGSNRKL